MKLNDNDLEITIDDYKKIIKNPRNWKLFRNFVIIQKDIKLKQAELISKELNIPIIPNIEQKICFTMYLLFEFPEITERIRRNLKIINDLENFSEKIALNYESRFLSIDSNDSILNDFMKLMGPTRISNQQSNTSTTNFNLDNNSNNIKDKLTLFIKKFHKDKPNGIEWDFLLLNNILTTSNLLQIEQAYNNKSNIKTTINLFKDKWEHFFQAIEEYINYTIDNREYPYVFTNIFIECAHQFNENKEKVDEYQKGALRCLSKITQNSEFLDIFTEQIIHKMHMATDFGKFANHHNKLFEINNFKIKDRTEFIDIFNYIVKIKLMNVKHQHSEEDKLYSILIKHCTYSNSILRIFHIPDSIQEYINNNEIIKSLTYTGSNATFTDDRIKNICIYSARIIELKFFISVLKEKESNNLRNSQNKKLENEISRIEIMLNSSERYDYVSINEGIIGKMILKCLNVINREKNINDNPVLEGLETLSLLTFQNEYQKPNKITPVCFPRILIKIIIEKNDPITEENMTKTKNLVFFNKELDQHINKLMKINRITNNNPKEQILRCMPYLFDRLKFNKEQSESHNLIGEIAGNLPTKVFIEEIVSKNKISQIEAKYNKLFESNKDKFLILVIMIVKGKIISSVNEMKKELKIGSNKVAIINSEEFT